MNERRERRGWVFGRLVGWLVGWLIVVFGAKQNLRTPLQNLLKRDPHSRLFNVSITFVVLVGVLYYVFWNL